MLSFKGNIVDQVCQKNEFSRNYLINTDKNINMQTTHASTKFLTGNDHVLLSLYKNNTFFALIGLSFPKVVLSSYI